LNVERRKRADSTYATINGEDVIVENTSSQDRESRMSQNKKVYNIPVTSSNIKKSASALKNTKK
jgi:hypothetical protein